MSNHNPEGDFYEHDVEEMEEVEETEALAYSSLSRTCSSTQDDFFCVFDFETSGLSPRIHRVIEVGAAIVRGDGSVIKTYQSLCCPVPGFNVPRKISDITHIDSRMISEAPSTAVVMQELLDFMLDYPVIGHNVAFDIRFLRAEFVRAGLDIPASCSPTVQPICTKSLAQSVRHLLQPQPANLKLVTLKVIALCAPNIQMHLKPLPSFPSLPFSSLFLPPSPPSLMSHLDSLLGIDEFC